MSYIIDWQPRCADCGNRFSLEAEETRDSKEKLHWVLFEGRQLAGALKTGILFASSGAVYFHVYLYIVVSAVSCKLEKWDVIAWLQHRRNWAVCGKDRWVSFVVNKGWEKLMLLKFVKSKRHRSCRARIKKCWQWKMQMKEGVRLHTPVSISEYPSL